MTPLLNTKQTAERLGLPRRTFDTHAKRGAFRRLLARHPIGRRIYDAALVEQYAAQQSVTQLVRRAS
jgi:hypothetical protein